MLAAVITKHGGPEVLQVKEVLTPEPKPGQVRIVVHATGVNRLDLLQRNGHYPAPADSPQDIPGVEFAGVIDAIADGVTNFKVGDRVFGLVGGGSYAEYLVVQEQVLSRIPDGISFTNAAAMPEAFMTAYDAMVTQAQLSAGETVLISAVGSGVGTAAVQIAKVIGAHSIGTARTAHKLEHAFQLGLNDGLVVSNPDFSQDITDKNSGRGVNVVLELVGGDYLIEDIKCAAYRARIAVVGLLAGSKVNLDLVLLLRKRLHIFGTVMRARLFEEKITATQIFNDRVVPLIANGSLHAVVDKVFTLNEAALAHEYMASNENSGKVVIVVGNN